MKNILYLSLIVTLFTACSQDVFETSNPKSNERNLSFEIKDKGYVSQDPPTTRTTTDNKFITHFTEGAEVGLYIVREGKVIATNIKVTAQKVGNRDSITWISETPVSYNSKDSYYLYYPYRSSPAEAPGIGDIFTPSSQNNKDSLFFANMIKKWEDGRDLMTGIGIVNGKTNSMGYALSTSMIHRMAAVLLQFPPTICKFSDKGIPDYTTDSVRVSSTSMVSISGLDYLQFVKPSETTKIIGSYEEAFLTESESYEFNFTVQNISAGTYKTYKIDEAKPIIRYFSLRLGDYFCTTKDKSDWFIKPQELVVTKKDNCIGIVTYVGNAPITDNYGLLKNEQFKGGVVHGIVAPITTTYYDSEPDGYGINSLYQANRGKSIWSSFTGQTNISEAWLKNSTWTGNIQRPNNFVSLEVTDKYQGYANTLALEEYNKQYEPVKGSKYINALDSLNKFRTQYHYKVPSNTSGWYLPSIKELIGIKSTMAINDNKGNGYYGRITAGIQYDETYSYPYNKYYNIWSSSESKYSTYSYELYDGGNNSWAYLQKRTENQHIWPMLVF